MMRSVLAPDSPCLCTSPCAPLPPAMKYSFVTHHDGLNPFQAAKAWHLRKCAKLPWKEVRAQLLTVSGRCPNRKAMFRAVARIDEQRHTARFQRTGTATLAYQNCGRKPMLSAQEKASVVDFVRRWRSKRFCTAAYIIQELRLACKKKTIHRALGEAGYHWRPVPKRSQLTEAQLAARKVFVDAHRYGKCSK